MNLEGLFKLWRETGQSHRFQPPATDADLAAAESKIGRRLPQAFQRLYRFSDGFSLNDGGLTVHPLLDGDELGSLVSMSDQYRAWEWSIPEEVLIFGSNGSDEIYGLWTGPHDVKRFPEPIVQIGEISEPGCMGLWAPSLQAFLWEQTVIDLVLDNRQSLVAEKFGFDLESLPDASMVDAMLQRKDSVGAEFVEAARRFRLIERRVAPHLDPASRDPYEARLDVEGMTALLA